MLSLKKLIAYLKSKRGSILCFRIVFFFFFFFFAFFVTKLQVSIASNAYTVKISVDFTIK